MQEGTILWEAFSRKAKWSGCVRTWGRNCRSLDCAALCRKKSCPTPGISCPTQGWGTRFFVWGKKYSPPFALPPRFSSALVGLPPPPADEKQLLFRHHPPRRPPPPP